MSFDRNIMTVVVLICLGMLFFGGWMIKHSQNKDAEICRLKNTNDSLQIELDSCIYKLTIK